MSHDDDFDLDLSAAAAAFDIPSGDVGAVVHRGRRRNRRKRAVLSMVTSVAVLTATVSAFGLVDDDRGVPVAAGGGVRKGDSGIRWERVSSSSALGFARSIDGSGPVYALSTAPGDVDPNGRNQSRVLWRSDDGVEWRSVSKLADDLFLSDLSSTGGRIYAVGTSPTTAAVPGQKPTPDLLVGWSDDGGETWRKATLPLDMRAIAARSTSSGVSFTDVAAGAKGTVAVAVPYAVLDVNKVLPAGNTAPNGWAISDDGIDVLGPRSANPCPAGTSDAPPGLPAPPPHEAPASPAQVPPPPGETPATSAPPAPDKPAVRLARPQPATTGEVHPTFCYRGESDPVEVTPQVAQGVTRHYTWDELDVKGDLLRAVRHQPVAFAADHDSTKFERVEVSGADEIYGPVTVHADDDGFDLVGARSSGRTMLARHEPPPMMVLHSVDGREWSPVDLDLPGVGWVAAAGKLDGRTTLVAGGMNGEPVLLRSDGAGGWTSSPFGGVVSRPAGTQVGVAGAAVGPLGVAAVVAVVPSKPEAPSDIAAAEPELKPDFRLLFSRDGLVWDDQPLGQLSGGQVQGVTSVVVTRQQVVVSAVLAQSRPGPNQKTARAILAGTLD
ncbi:MAG TPA: hypothetical protein VNA57_01295 [Acidimicrobiales bacterium]|nr:hypothetical protein [Acidimicrobiales bacterium]